MQDVEGPGQLTQFPTRPKTNSPNFGQLAQKPTRPITNSPKIGQLAKFFPNLLGQLAQNRWSSRPNSLPTRPNLLPTRPKLNYFFLCMSLRKTLMVTKEK